MPAAHTVALDDWKPYEDLSDYEKRDSGYESGGSGSNWRRVGRRRERAKNPTTGSQHDWPYAQAVFIHGIAVRLDTGGDGGGLFVYTESRCLLLFLFLFSATLLRGYLVLYKDTGQGTAQGLDNAAGSPLGHALPRHIYIG